MGIEFFTNEKKTEQGEVDISSPAFSSTKVLATFGAVITAALAAVPAAVKDHDPVVVAAIAAATLILLGIFALIAVDMRTRQKASEAKLRFGGGGAPKAGEFGVLPVEDALVVQTGTNEDEYRVKSATVKDDGVELHASRNGKFISLPFAKLPSDK